jgi:transcriptional regulator with XRE-family HTH domain
MPTDIRIRFARHLKELRQRRGYSVPELAKRSGVSRQHIRDLELDVPQKRVTIITLEKLAKGLDIPIWELLRFRH